MTTFDNIIRVLFGCMRKNRNFLYTIIMLMFSVCIISGCSKGEDGWITEDTLMEEESEATEMETSETIPVIKTEEKKAEATSVAMVEPETTATEETAEEKTWMIDSIEEIPKERVMEVLSVWNHEGSCNSFLIPDSDTRFLTAKEVSGYTKMELRLIRNEIAARHGCDFNDPVLHSYFITQQWYTPKYGQNDSIVFNETEKANMALLDQKEREPEKELFSTTRGEFIELDFYKDYRIVFDDYETTLRLTNYPGEQAYFPYSDIIYNGETMRVYDEDNYVGLYDTHSAMLYNLPNKSYLFLTGNTGVNDWEATFKYRLTKDGIEQYSFSGGDDTENGVSVGNSFCSHIRTMLAGYMYLYDWSGLDAENGETYALGKSAIAWGEEELTRPLTCYIIDENGIAERVLEKGEVISFETYDDRQYRDTMSCMLGISLQTGEVAYIPLFVDENDDFGGYYSYTQEGIALPEYFDKSHFSWAG